MPKIVSEASKIPLRLGHSPYKNPNYLQCRLQYMGPVSKNTVKVGVSKEPFIGEVIEKGVPPTFDYPPFKVSVYSLENILAEKIRTLLERGKVKDYYDVWRLLKVEKFENERMKKLFLQKCNAKGIIFNGVEQFFPADLLDTLRPHVKMGLARLSSEPLPPLELLIKELKTSITEVLV